MRESEGEMENKSDRERKRERESEGERGRVWYRSLSASDKGTVPGASPSPFSTHNDT